MKADRPVSTQRFEDYIYAHEREHEQLEEAITRAREVTDMRLEGMNELRAQINDERGLFVTRTTYDTLSDRVAKSETAQLAAQKASVAWVAAVGVVFGIVQILMYFLQTTK